METDLKRLKITESKLQLLESMKITSINDLLTYYPSKYDVIKKTLPNSTSNHIIDEATVIESPKVLFIKKNMTRMSFKAIVNEQEYLIIIFNRHFLRSKLTVGSVITIIGKVDFNKHIIVVTDIKFNRLDTISGIYPIYSLKRGITNKSIQNYMTKALNLVEDELVDFIPEKYIHKYHLITLKEALKQIHFPSSELLLKQAIKYLKYEEFLKFHLTMLYIKKYYHTQNIGIAKKYDQCKLNNYIQQLPFKLTDDQLKVTQEILNDLKSPIIMDRLVQGDVGSGKTVVASIALYANFLSGFQGALMAPTEILATQHFETLTALFKNTNIKIGLLIGSLSSKNKTNIKNEIASGNINIVVGTHALIQEGVSFYQLGLVIADEQHRFGVKQRQKLQDKGKKADLLTMSATPIPRTLSMVMYGDKDVSTIKHKPSQRKEVITKVIKTKSMKPILHDLNQYLLSGGQCYVVCPLVEESENITNVSNAVSIYEGMRKYFKDRVHVGLLHGKMNDEDKENVMKQFLNHDIDILVSTTVIEVGVDVKNANMMVIYDAHRFGLSQLHQLRGRVGRSNQQGYCYLFTSSEDLETIEKLKFLEENSDGFKISQYDLQLRGPGEMLGQKQSGLPSFLIADVFKDFNILELARNDAAEIIEHIEENEYSNIQQVLKNKIQNNDTYLD